MIQYGDNFNWEMSFRADRSVCLSGNPIKILWQGKKRVPAISNEITSGNYVGLFIALSNRGKLGTNLNGVKII